MRKCLAYFVLTVIAIFSPASGTLGQTVQGVITGTVTDPSGATVPDATVTITNSGTGLSQSATTGSDGSYRFSLVPPGNYVISIKAANFKEVRATGIVVEASQTVPYSVKLELAKGSEIIEVNEQVPLVQTATSDLSTQIDRETILSTPLADRDVFSTLPFLAPSVTPGMNLNPASGGARESGTAYLLNGGDDNDNFSEGAINIHPPLESVQDFTIKTNSMTAEYGRGAGAVVSANQKSGTNRFHGAIYEFNRNALLNANDWFYDRDVHNDDQGLLSKRPKYIRNQFGGEVDGPILKDKTFFSFAYDRFKILAGTTAANNYVPTSAGLAFAEANAGSIASQILTAFPPVTSDSRCPANPTWSLPDGSDSGLPATGAGTNPNTGLPNSVGCLSFFDPQTDTNDSYYARVDHNFSSKDRISVSANIFRESYVDQFGGGPLTTAGPINGTTTNHYHQISVNETHIFNPRILNEFTITHNRHYNVFIEGDGTTTVPNIYIDNELAGCLNYQIGGPYEGGQVQGFVQDRWGASDNFTITRGRHSIKIGGGTQYGILYRNWDLGLPGQYEFGELTAVDSTGAPVTPETDPNGSTRQSDGTIAGIPDTTLSNFTGDYPYFQETSVDPSTGAHANAYRHYTYHDYYVFFQDDWKVTSKLTLNLGVRWDRYGAPSEAHNIMAQFTNLGCNILEASCLSSLRVNPVNRMWPTYNKDIGPRIGFAWDPTGKGKTAIRGGYGIYYDRIFDNIWSNGAWNPPFYALLDFNGACSDAIFYSNPASIGSAYDPSNPIPYPGKRVSLRSMDQNMKDSSGHNYYLGIERQVFGGLLLRAAYQGSFGRHLPMLENYNRVDGQAYSSSFASVPPNPLYNGFNYRSNSVSSNYNSLVLEAQKRMGHGLQFQTSYTFSKLLDVNSDLFAGCSTIGSVTAPYYYITNSQPGLSHGPAAYDHKNAYKFSVTYELPFMKGEKGILGHALGGWSVGSFMQYYSGHPIDVFIGSAAGGASPRYRARDASGAFVLDQNGVPFNIGEDFNMDGVYNDHPVFLGSSVSSVYGSGSPADGIFTDNNQIGCGFASLPSTVANVGACNTRYGVVTPSTLFGNPDYPSGGTPYERFGTLGRNVFHGPKFIQVDLGLSKSFKLTEAIKLDFRAQAQNLANHPNFDCIDSSLRSSTFGQAQCLTPFGLGAPKSRVMSLGLRLAF
jgi:hypothetical protein